MYDASAVGIAHGIADLEEQLQAPVQVVFRIEGAGLLEVPAPVDHGEGTI